MIVFKKCFNLKKVVLCNVNITSITFQYLSRLKFLKTLALKKCFVSDASFHNLGNLIDLSIKECCWVSDSSLDYITQIHGLKRLVLSNNCKANGNLVNFELRDQAVLPMLKIKDLALLESSDISDTEISYQDALIPIIMTLKSLKELSVTFFHLSFSIMDKICDLPLLTKLSMSCLSCSIYDDLIPALARLKKLPLVIMMSQMSD